jgi:hypothetical protein
MRQCGIFGMPYSIVSSSRPERFKTSKIRSSHRRTPCIVGSTVCAAVRYELLRMKGG